MWNNSKSLRLSRYLLWAAMLLWLCVLPFVGKLWRYNPVYVLMYALSFFPALLTWFTMLKFLRNIAAGVVFCAENVAFLRAVSWYCLICAIIFLSGGLFAPVFIICAGVVGFFGVLMRVVKNMLAEANQIKEENDYTI